MSETPLGPKNQKEKIAEIMFEQLNVAALAVASDAVLALYG